ncbi:MAG: D-alanyl-D-alanine carboxypeptidase/D-alanyl-D-alanine-endopeptidase [Succinivibrionaceae bacterium]
MKSSLIFGILLTLSISFTNQALAKAPKKATGTINTQKVERTTNASMTDGAYNGLAYMIPRSNQIYGYNKNQYFLPASTEKIITSLAALLYLGPNYQLTTKLMVDKNTIENNELIVKNGVLHSDIEINFGGDPTLTSNNLRELLRTLKTKGVHTINGNILLNYGYFTGHDYASGWSWDDLSKCFTAPASAIIINGNCSYIKLTAKEIGGKISVEIPTGTPITVNIDNLEVVTPKEFYGGCTIELDRDSRNIYQLSGCIPVQKPKDKPLGLALAIQDPNQWGIDIVTRILLDLSLKYTGDVQAIRKSNSDMIQISEYRSKPLRTMLDRCLKKSVNLYADSIAKVIGAKYFGRPANYHMATIAIRNILKKAGIDLGNATIVDGSGLSSHNYITPIQMLNILKYIKDNDQKLNFIKLLPVAGVSGTLGGRNSVQKPPLVKNVAAKTGTLNGVSNLAGFLTTQSGEIVPFVYFVNNLSYDLKTHQRLESHRISKPHYKHEKQVLESIYYEEIINKMP